MVVVVAVKDGSRGCVEDALLSLAEATAFRIIIRESVGYACAGACSAVRVFEIAHEPPVFMLAPSNAISVDFLSSTNRNLLFSP